MYGILLHVPRKWTIQPQKELLHREVRNVRYLLLPCTVAKSRDPSGLVSARGGRARRSAVANATPNVMGSWSNRAVPAFLAHALTRNTVGGRISARCT